MQHGITRRDFLRYSATTFGSLWLASLLPTGAGRARSTSAPMTASAPGTDALPLSGILGAPVDVGIGRDGVYWVTSDVGAPSSYDPVNTVWQPFGAGIDAAAHIPYYDAHGNLAVAVHFFRGSEVFQLGQAQPSSIAARWPGLPSSFQGGVDGAAYADENLAFLFRHGQAAAVDAAGEVLFIRPLTNFAGVGWPGGAWQDGKFDYVISGIHPFSVEPTNWYFVLGDEYITADLIDGAILTTPAPLSDLYQGAALAVLTQDGVQAALYDGPVEVTDAPFSVFGGPVVYALESATSTTPPQTAYIAQQDANWPESWHPVLSRAPAGQIGALWGLSRAGVPLFNDGAGWQAQPLPGAIPAAAIDVTAAGNLFAVAGNAIYSLDAGAAWSKLGEFGVTFADIAVGAGPFANSVAFWMNDSQGNLWSYDGNQFAQVDIGAAVTDIAANLDGSIWHCNATPNVYRYLSQGFAPTEIVNIDQTVSSVQRIASSGFGASFFLAQQNGGSALIRYTSSYAVKTSGAYTNADARRIAVGASSLFMYTADPYGAIVAAVDIQSGGENWRYSYDGFTPFTFAPVYDPHHQLVYVVAGDSELTALDAATGALRWSTTIEPPIAAQPVLAAGLLLVAGLTIYNSTEAEAYLTAIDTLAALQRAAARQPVVARWQYTQFIVADIAQEIDLLAPAAANGVIYLAVWTSTEGSGALTVNKIAAATGGGEPLDALIGLSDSVYAIPAISPITVQMTLASGQQGPALVVPGAAGLYAILLDGSGEWWQYTLAGSANAITTDLSYADGVVYFGDSSGYLHGLDDKFNPVPGAPFKVTDGQAISALTFVPSAGETTLAFVSESDQIDFFGASSMNTLSLRTNQTVGVAISDVSSEGILYVGGRGAGRFTDSLGQVFGIRTNDLGALRDFIIESQLMQDYDPGAVPVARYQTHVTVVDDQKTPQGYTSVKLWADAALTVIVAGQPYTIGPDTPLATAVDASGTLTILSNATDLFATPLRLWASFMGPAERIVIYPDETFHARLPAMTADPNNDEPTTINLATGANYAGIQTFPDQSQAQSVAQQIGSVTSALGLGARSASATMASAAARRYKAHADLEGFQYFYANTPATRTAAPQSPFGLSLDETNNFTTMTPAVAAALIDQLEGALPVLARGGLRSIFSSLWHDIKRGVAAVEQAVVSIGSSIYVGLSYVVDGVKYVFRQVVREIEDVAALIGAFFVKLGKAIEDVIELLSLLLHFTEIIKTYQLLRPHLLAQVDALRTIIPDKVIPAVNTFFHDGEQAILNAFCTVKQEIDPDATCDSALRAARATAVSPAVSSFSGVGSTPQTIFTVAPKGGGVPTSHSVHATWGLHKFKDHYKQAAPSSAASPATDPLAEFFQTFIGRLTSDLAPAFAATQTDFANTFKVKSSSELLQMAIVDLLDICQDLLVASLAITNAFLDMLLALADEMVDYLVDPDQGLLLRPLNIPILSDLFTAAGLGELTFFNLIVLVASIPVTILYRVIEGQWLSEATDTGADSGLSRQIAATSLERAFGLLNVVFYAGNGFVAPSADAFIVTEDVPPILNIVLIGLGLGTTVTSANDIESAEGAAALGINIVMLFANELKNFGPVVLSACALGAIATAIVEKMKSEATWLAFSADILSDFPPLVRPLEYLAQEFPFATTTLLGSIDMLANFATAAAQMLNVWTTWDAETPTALPPDAEPPLAAPGRIFLPFVQGQP